MSAGRALVISPRLPEFDRESGLLRVMHMIEQRGVETYAPIRSIDAIREPSEFKLAIIVFWHVAERLLPELRRAAPSARVIVDSVDLHFLRDMRDKLRPDGGDAS